MLKNKFKKFVEFLLIVGIILSVASAFAKPDNSQEVELRKMAVPLEKTLSKLIDTYLSLLDPTQIAALNQILQSLQDLIGLPMKVATENGWARNDGACGFSYAAHVQNRNNLVRLAIADGLYQCVTEGKKGCTFARVNVLHEYVCTVKSFITYNEFSADTYKMLSEISQNLEKITKVTEIFTAEDRNIFNGFYLKLNRFLAKGKTSSRVPIFKGTSSTGGVCNEQSAQGKHNRENNLRYAFERAVNSCNEAGYLNCRAVKLYDDADSPDLILQGYFGGLVTNEDDCEAHMWVQPVAE